MALHIALDRDQALGLNFNKPKIAIKHAAKKLA